jgi:MFS family permease
MIKRPRFFFGWYLVGLMVIAMTLVYGVRNAFSVFFGPVLEEFGWYRGSTSIMLALNILVYGLTAPVAGSLVDRWKPRRVVFAGIFVLALATALCSLASELWHFYLLFGIVAPIGTAFCGAPVLNPAVMHWFSKKRQLAIGMGQIGGGLSFAYSMLVEAVISTWNWNASFLVMAGLLIVVLLPLYLFFYHFRPEDRGLRADNMEQTVIVPEIKTDIVTAVNDWTLATAVKTYRLWMLVLSQVCYWGIGNYLVLAHQIKFAVDVGFSSALATSVFAMFGIASIIGQIVSPISDRIGREKTVTIAVVLAIGALAALISVKDTSQLWLLYFYAVCSGFATGLFSPTIFVAVADIFHGRNIGAIAAMVLTGTGIGGAIGPWLGGYVYDITGSYDNAFIISMAAFAVAGISCWIAGPRHAKKLRELHQVNA